MTEMYINGVKVRYSISYYVSRNPANPHRVNAYCECGMQFMQMGAARGIEKRVERYVTQSFNSHQSKGHCRLVNNTCEI